MMSYCVVVLAYSITGVIINTHNFLDKNRFILRIPFYISDIIIILCIYFIYFVVFLDLPMPWRTIDFAKDTLKVF